MRQETHRRATALLLAGLVLPVSLPADDQAGNRPKSRPDVGGTLTLTTDYVFRGVSQTLGKPAIQLDVGFEWPSGWYAYAWASTVDFVAAGNPEDGADVELNTALGFAVPFFDRWAADVVVVNYHYPGTVQGADYDYVEIIASVWLDELVGATVGYSSNVFGTGREAWVYELGAQLELPGKLDIAAGAGWYDLSASAGDGYAYTALALSRTFERATVSLICNYTSSSARDLFSAELTGRRLVAALSISF
ncbi:MAG: TorF family putative porin [Pseudomonadota bacterium]